MISCPHPHRITGKNDINVIELGIKRLDTVGLDKNFPRDLPNITMDKNKKNINMKDKKTKKNTTMDKKTKQYHDIFSTKLSVLMNKVTSEAVAGFDDVNVSLLGGHHPPMVSY